MEKIHRFLECLVPVTACNLKCEYCYVIQEERRKSEIPIFKYSPEHIGKALNKERLGGTSLISITGAGETLIPKEMPKIIEEILKQGHYVNITTNGTLSNRFDEILSISKDLLNHLHFSFSLHYIELKKKNLLDTFFKNIKKVKENGCSFLVQINLYDGYLPYLDEIKKRCIDEVGAYPQVAATRLEELNKNGQISKFKIHTNLEYEEYKNNGDSFNSPLFEITMKNFNVKRNEFCYAGDWSLLLNLMTGDITRCYFESPTQNIYKDITKPIRFKAIGNNCKCKYCVNSSHFLTLGTIPELKIKSYAEARNREEANWYSKEVLDFLNSKLYETHNQYKKFKKFIINHTYKLDKTIFMIKRKMRKILKDGK